jgi:hypothetical protein
MTEQVTKDTAPVCGTCDKPLDPAKPETWVSITKGDNAKTTIHHEKCVKKGKK